MRIQTDFALPNTLDRLVIQLNTVLGMMSRQVNGISEGAMAASYAARTSVPTTGTWAQGDYVRKSNPVEAGGAGNKYIIKGWTRVTSGTGNTLNTDWFEDRSLTGN
jgi:hypothetical protein